MPNLIWGASEGSRLCCIYRKRTYGVQFFNLLILDPNTQKNGFAFGAGLDLELEGFAFFPVLNGLVATVVVS